MTRRRAGLWLDVAACAAAVACAFAHYVERWVPYEAWVRSLAGAVVVLLLVRAVHSWNRGPE